jgi:hypothetical protein
MVRKYGALRFVAFICQVLAWVILLISVVGAGTLIVAVLFNLIDLSPVSTLFGGLTVSLVIGIIGGATALFLGAAGCMAFMAFSQAIYLQIDLEQNTRYTAELLRQMVYLQASILPAADSAPEPAFAPPPVTSSAAAPAPETDPLPAPAASPYAPPARATAAPTITTRTPPSS